MTCSAPDSQGLLLGQELQHSCVEGKRSVKGACR
jgi:hypothetical protein